MSDSRYNDISNRRVPRRKKTIQIYGSGDDSGKWFKCWNCGFINNVDRNSVGTGEGINYTLNANDNDILLTGSGNHFAGNSGSVVLIGPGPAKNNIGAEAVSGCSFCGSRNYR